MRKTNFAFIIFLFFSNFIFANFPDGVNSIEVIPNKITTIRGNLADGKFITDLKWASKSTVACFPATQNKKFNGKHLLYGFSMPEYADVSISITPRNKHDNFSLYGYQVGINESPVVPDLDYCIACEASHKDNYRRKGEKQKNKRIIRFNSTNHTYNIFIGVTGANKLDEGEFTLRIRLTTRNMQVIEQKELIIYSAESEKGKMLTYEGNLAEGVKINDLDWASNSAIACFPATQNHNFSGNHLIYITEIPAHSKMTITVIPENKKANMSLYAYMVAPSDDAMVPNLYSCLTCEAAYKWDYKKYGQLQNHTRTVHLNALTHNYRVVIGVAGADGLDTGIFKLAITTN